MDALYQLEQCMAQPHHVTDGSIEDDVTYQESIELLDEVYRREQLEVERLGKRLAQISEQLPRRFDEFRSIDVPIQERHRARRVLGALVRDVFVEAVHTIDFTLELRKRGRLVSPEEIAPVYYYLIAVAGWPDGLERENHMFGYHFHHVETSRKVTVRTSVLLTFDPAEKLGPPDSLHWEYHSGSKKRADPLRWGRKRCIAVHTAAKPSLFSVSKTAFQSPSLDAIVLCSR